MRLNFLNINKFITYILVAKFASEEVKPHVRQMDRDGKMRPEIIKGLFENGVSNSLETSWTIWLSQEVYGIEISCSKFKQI